jgi:hypothetical protein
MPKLDRWLPVSVILGTWAGYCWFNGPYGPLDGFLIGMATVVGIGALASLRG